MEIFDYKAEGWSRCGRCKGSGTTPDAMAPIFAGPGDYMTCPVCNGCGWIDGDEEKARTLEQMSYEHELSALAIIPTGQSDFPTILADAANKWMAGVVRECMLNAMADDDEVTT